MGFLWLTGFSFFHCVASPFHSFVTTQHTLITSMWLKWQVGVPGLWRRPLGSTRLHNELPAIRHAVRRITAINYALIARSMIRGDLIELKVS